MKRPLLWAVVSAVLVAIVIIVGAVTLTSSGDDNKNNDDNASLMIANSFPVPEGSTPAFPDSVLGDVATKGWRAAGTLSEACGAWRNAYRTWIEQGPAGSVTGEDEDGRRCTLSGPKLDHRADLSVTIYGEDPTPQVTLTVQKLVP